MASSAPKSLSRLSRASLLRLALKWLNNPTMPKPYLANNRDIIEEEQEDYLYTPAEDIDALRRIYESLGDDTNTTKRDIIERMVEGDWRRGLSLHQLAMIDLQHLEENDLSLRWSALKLVPLDGDDEPDGQPARKRRKVDNDENFPRIQPATFLQSLKHEISPLVKAHYYLHRLPPPYDLTILRIYITDTLFTNSNTSTRAYNSDGYRALYIALPDSCPYVYIAISGSTGGSAGSKKRNLLPKPDIASMKRTVLEAIPKAFSRPQERWALETTHLVARSLRTICEMRGTGRAENSAGAYSVFSEAVVDTSPLDAQATSKFIQTQVETDVQENQEAGEAQLLARFGPGLSHGVLDRFHVKIENVAAASTSCNASEPPASMSLSFSGTDVFAGLRKLAGLGSSYIDMEKMPAWMTGEEGVSTLTV